MHLYQTPQNNRNGTKTKIMETAVDAMDWQRLALTLPVNTGQFST